MTLTCWVWLLIGLWCLPGLYLVITEIVWMKRCAVLRLLISSWLETFAFTLVFAAFVVFWPALLLPDREDRQRRAARQRRDFLARSKGCLPREE